MALIANGGSWTFMVRTSNSLCMRQRIHIHSTGFDDDVLAMIPRPSTAIIFLFPGSPAYDDFWKRDEARLALNKQTISNNVVHFEQTIENACGMMALLHSLSNNRQIIGLFRFS